MMLTLRLQLCGDAQYTKPYMSMIRVALLGILSWYALIGGPLTLTTPAYGFACTH